MNSRPRNTSYKKSKIKIAAAAGVVLICIAAALAFLIDADQFRPQIESRLSAELGREVRLGKLRLSLFSGNLSVDDISIADNPEFGESPFVTARSFYIRVKLMPLIFSKEIHIVELYLERPSIYLRRFAGGKWNFSNLGAGIGGEADALAGKSESVSDIRIERLQITDGRVEIIEAEKKPSVYEKVAITVDNLSRFAEVPFALEAASQGEGRFAAHGTFGPLNREDMLRTPFEAVLKITSFDPAASGLVAAGAGFSGMFDFSGDLNSDGSTAESKGKATASNLRFVSGGTSAVKPVSFDYDVSYDLVEKNDTFADATVGFGQAAMQLSGSFDASGDVSALKMTLKGSGVPIDEIRDFLPSFGITLPKGAEITGGILNTDITVKGSLDKLEMDGSAEITGTTLTGFSLVEKFTAVAGAAGRKSGMDTQIEKLYASMRWIGGGITVNNIQLVIPSLGEISGAGTISPKQELDLTMRAVVNPVVLAALTKGKALDVKFFVRGVAADPEFIPDYESAARSLIDAVLTGKGSESGPANKIMDFLKKR